LIALGAGILIATVVLALLMLAAVWLMNKATAKLVGDKHRTLESIVESGEAPYRWRASYEREIARLKGSEENAVKIADLQERARQDHLKRLDKLIKYARTSPLIDGEDTRSLLLDRLNAVRADWQKGTS
jgi:hypothetical protein